MKEIPLTKGFVTVVDDDDFTELSQHKWLANVSISGRVYAQRRLKIGGKWKHEYMHRRLLGEPQDLDVDHINGDSLDNRRVNLRACSRSENLINSINASRGAFFDKRTRKWFARISHNGKRYFLGRFPSQQEAIAAIAEARATHRVGTKTAQGARTEN